MIIEFYSLLSINSVIFTDVKVYSKEVAAGTSTTLTCVVSNLTPAGITIKWLLKDEELTMNSNYPVTIVHEDISDGSQVSTLSIPNPTRSEIFTCQVSSVTYPDSPISATLVYLFVYGKLISK